MLPDTSFDLKVVIFTCIIHFSFPMCEQLVMKLKKTSPSFTFHESMWTDANISVIRCGFLYLYTVK